jgi:hypothetical protein
MRHAGKAAHGAEDEQQIVMEVVDLVCVGRDAVDIDADEQRRGVRQKFRASLLDYFAPPGIPNLGVFGFDVPAGEEPAIQSAMMNDQELPVGRHDETGACDVPGVELRTGKRVLGTIQEVKEQLLALKGSAVCGVIEQTGGGLNAGGSDHKRKGCGYFRTTFQERYNWR